MANSGLVGSSFTLTRTGRAAYWALLIALFCPPCVCGCVCANCRIRYALDVMNGRPRADIHAPQGISEHR
jgi:hypothetical protein